jgi:hypothetical protein
MGAVRRRGRAAPYEKENAMPAEFIQPPDLNRAPTYTPTVKVGNTVYIAGQTSVDEKGEVVGKGDITAQTTQVMENLGKALRAAGADYGNLVNPQTNRSHRRAGGVPAGAAVRGPPWLGRSYQAGVERIARAPRPVQNGRRANQIGGLAYGVDGHRGSPGVGGSTGRCGAQRHLVGRTADRSSGPGDV